MSLVFKPPHTRVPLRSACGSQHVPCSPTTLPGVFRSGTSRHMLDFCFINLTCHSPASSGLNQEPQPCIWSPSAGKGMLRQGGICGSSCSTGKTSPLDAGEHGWEQTSRRQIWGGKGAESLLPAQPPSVELKPKPIPIPSKITISYSTLTEKVKAGRKAQAALSALPHCSSPTIAPRHQQSP